MSAFRDNVLKAVRGIPTGSVLTYKEVARIAGSPRAFRAVGSILKSNYDPAIPCHRVIKSNGELGNYNRGSAQKRKLLSEEGAL